MCTLWRFLDRPLPLYPSLLGLAVLCVALLLRASHHLCFVFSKLFLPPLCMQDQINSRVDLVLRMADEKWRLAQHAYDRLDVNIRRLDADLGRMEVWY